MLSVEIDYDNKKVKDLFSDFNKMKKKTDAVFTKQVKKRYDQLLAFETFADYLKSKLGDPHPLEGKKKGDYGITVTKNKRLIVSPVTDDLSLESLKICKKIIIKGVEDYHGTKITTYIP